MKTRRTTLRALMIAVALAALACWGWVLRQRSARFVAEARKHYQRMELCLANRESIILDPHVAPPLRCGSFTEAEQAELAMYDRWISYEEELIRKYRWAAIFPWVSPEEDPPTPTPFHPWW